jgi:glucokinase
MLLLAGDVGATKTILAIVSTEKGPEFPVRRATVLSGKYPNLPVLLDEFLGSSNVSVERVRLGVAGPVVEGRVEIMNLAWKVDEGEIRDRLRLSDVKLLNDLVAISCAIPHLNPTDLHTLNVGQPVAEGAIAVIAPGTGLGEGFLVWDGERYTPHPSEGGHADFSPADMQQAELFAYLLGKNGHVSNEQVCSGKGIPNIYAFLKDAGYAPEPGWLAEKLSRNDDPTPVIVDAALSSRKSCPLCEKTLDMFISILGAESGNLALKVLATGGVYIGGGIPPRILPILQRPRFLEAFTHKGRIREIMSNIPVHVILNPSAAVLGAAYYGMDR